MNGLKVVAVGASMLALGACAQGSGPGQGQIVGTGAGAAVGGIAGYLLGGRSATGAVIGALAGGLIGNRIGALLDEREQARLAEASRQAAEARTGEKVAWQATDAQGKPTASGWVVPISDPAPGADGKPCRQVRQSAEKGGQTSEQDVTLCRSDSGWVMPA